TAIETRWKAIRFVECPRPSFLSAPRCPQHGARFGFANESRPIFRQQEPIPHGLLGGALHDRDVILVRAVALLDRGARIVVAHPLRPGLRERDPAALKSATLSCKEAGSDRVPTEVGP